MQDFARPFYHSKAWKEVRKAALIRDGGMCQMPGCNRPASVVHHKIRLTPYNIDNPSVTLSLENLISVCDECHAAIHSQDKEDGRKAATKNRAAEKLLHGGGILPPVIFVDGIPTEIGTADRPGRLVMVCGLIGSGKSTYCRKMGGAYTDLDEIPSHRKADQIQQTEALIERDGECMHITCWPTLAEWELIATYEHIEMVWIDTPEDVCLQRVRARGRARDMLDLEGVRKANRRYLKEFQQSDVRDVFRRVRV